MLQKHLGMMAALLALGSWASAQFVYENQAPDQRPKPKPQTVTDDKTLLAASKLKLHYPVPKSQATILARAYFFAYISGCGNIQTASDEGTSWVFPTLTGYSPKPGPDIRVKKATGTVTSLGGVTVRDAKSFAQCLGQPGFSLADSGKDKKSGRSTRNRKK